MQTLTYSRRRVHSKYIVVRKNETNTKYLPPHYEMFVVKLFSWKITKRGYRDYLTL